MMLEPGVHISSAMGQYQSVQLIELAIQHGYEDDVIPTDELERLLELYTDHTWENVTINTRSDGTHQFIDEADLAQWVYDTAEYAQSWINDNLVPPGFWFGSDPDTLDIGVWEVGEEW